MWMCPAVLGPGTHSSASTPMRRRRHSSESDWPVEIAKSGMLPSPMISFLGMRSVLSGCGLSMHLVTLGIMNSLRHLPVCTTRGTLLPGGTLSTLKCPVASVTALPKNGGYSASHERHAAPLGRAGSVADLGANTVML